MKLTRWLPLWMPRALTVWPWGSPGGGDGGPQDDDHWRRARERMVDRQLASRDIDSARVLSAMGAVPRHRFVPSAYHSEAYADHPLPIGQGQTISQPYIVALMTQLSGVRRGDKVLEIGCGSGYQAAVLAELGAEICSVEIVTTLAEAASTLLAELGYERVQIRAGDGYAGWPDGAPFDAVIITAAPPAIPKPLQQQLRVGGRLVVPVGRGVQDLVVVTRTGSGFEQRSTVPVRFVPMTGEADRM